MLRKEVLNQSMSDIHEPHCGVGSLINNEVMPCDCRLALARAESHNHSSRLDQYTNQQQEQHPNQHALNETMLESCTCAFTNMQTHIRLRQWDKLDGAASLIDAAMQGLAQALQHQHDIPQQALIHLSFTQRRVTRMLHNAMLSNRNDIAEVQQGLMQLGKAQQHAQQPEHAM